MKLPNVYALLVFLYSDYQRLTRYSNLLMKLPNVYALLVFLYSDYQRLTRYSNLLIKYATSILVFGLPKVNTLQ